MGERVPLPRRGRVCRLTSAKRTPSLPIKVAVCPWILPHFHFFYPFAPSVSLFLIAFPLFFPIPLAAVHAVHVRQMTEPTYDLARFVKPAPASSPTWEWLTHLKVEERRAQIARRSLSQQVSFLALAAPSFKASEVETGLRAFLDDFNRSNEEPGLNPSDLFSDSQAYYRCQLSS